MRLFKPKIVEGQYLYSMSYKDSIRSSSKLLIRIFYLVLGFFSNHHINAIHLGRTASEANVRGGGLASKIISDDLHLPIPDDSNTAVGSSQVNTQSSSRLQLELDQIGGLVLEILKYAYGKSKTIND